MSSAVNTVDLNRLLRVHGFSRIEAELTSNFIRHVLEIFRSAAAELLKTENWEKFKRKRGALSKPRRTKNKKIKKFLIEDAITTELEPFLHHFRRKVPKDHFLNNNQVAFQADPFVSSETRAGRHSKRADFRVYTQARRNPTEIVIEAKPLVKEKDINNRYLGKDGIGCFFMMDSPYTRGPLGGMLAYTINDCGRSWRAEVREAVNKYKPRPLHVASAAIVGEPNPITFSRHKRKALKLKPITFLHFEMIFPPDIQDSQTS